MCGQRSKADVNLERTRDYVWDFQRESERKEICHSEYYGFYTYTLIFITLEIYLMLHEMPSAYIHTHTRYHAVYFTYADEHSLEKGSHRFHALCAKVNRRGKRKLPVILTGTKVQPPTTKTTKKLENPRSAAARFAGARSRRKRSNGTGGSYRRSFTRMHNYPVSWRTSSTRVSIAALSCFFLLSLDVHPRFCD